LIEAAIEAKSLDDPAAFEMLLNPPLKKAALSNTNNVLEARASTGRGAAAAAAGAGNVAGYAGGTAGATGGIDSSGLNQSANIAAAAAAAAAIVQNQMNNNAQSSAAGQRTGR